MKLHQYVNNAPLQRKLVMEASGHTLEPILDCIINNEKSGTDLNEYEVFVLANLSWFFSSGRTATNGQLDGIVAAEANSTSTEMTEYIRSLSADEVVSLATELKWCVVMGNSHSPVAASTVAGMTPTAWIGYVLRKQR